MPVAAPVRVAQFGGLNSIKRELFQIPASSIARGKTHMNRFASLFLIAIVLVPFSLFAQNPPLDPVLKERAARVQATLDKIERDSKTSTRSRSYELVEEDLNAYLQLEARKHPKTGLKSLSAELRPDNAFTVQARIDPEKVDLESSYLSYLQMLFKEDLAVELEGVLHTANGSGTYSVTGAAINGITVPANVVQQLLSAVGKRFDPPFDPAAGFALEYDIDRIEISKGRATVYAGKR
jgi:hypothetical protein